MREVRSEVQLLDEIAPLGLAKGLVSFDETALSKGERGFIKVIEGNGKGRALEISGIKLE
jgi:hypothetical protein